MSDHPRSSVAQNKPASGLNSGLRRRLPIYAGIAVIGVLALAYVDAGEEPIHPIEQRIALPGGAGGEQ